MEIDPVLKLMLGIVSGAVIGFIFKIIWDWLKTGRFEKGVYVTSVHCEQIRDKCCMPQIKKDVEVLKTEMKAHEKKLDQGREDFRLLRKDIGSIKESLAGIKSVLDSVLRKEFERVG